VSSIPTAVTASLAVLLLAACTSPGTSPDTDAVAGTTSASATSSAPIDRDHPVGIVALGHSGMTGFQSDPTRPGENVVANSWATGSNPAVQSVYQRLVAVVPETADHVANVARNGEKADGLEFQVPAALNVVPVPRLALVQIMDNDIACDGTDSAHLPVFRKQVRAAVEQLVAASPKVTVVLVSGPGRPGTYAAVMATLPQTPVDLIGSDPCHMFSAPKVVNPRAVAHLTGLMEAYERELAKACVGIPQCHTDGGAAARMRDRLEGLGNDLGHPSVQGHADTAAAVWPAVSAALGLP
jgi:hypothetical protein